MGIALMRETSTSYFRLVTLALNVLRNGKRRTVTTVGIVQKHVGFFIADYLLRFRIEIDCSS
jgi:hypothetical protein